MAVAKPEETEAVSFIELPPISENQSKSCRIELKRPDGTEMQICLSSSPDTDLSELIKAFVNCPKGTWQSV